jgi:hypothetical protein
MRALPANRASTASPTASRSTGTGPRGVMIAVPAAKQAGLLSGGRLFWSASPQASCSIVSAVTVTAVIGASGLATTIVSGGLVTAS